MFLKELILSEIFGQLWNFPRINWIFIDWLMAHVNLTSTQTKEKINYKFKSLPFNFVLFESSSLNKFIPLRLIFYSSDKVSKIINKWKKRDWIYPHREFDIVFRTPHSTRWIKSVNISDQIQVSSLWMLREFRRPWEYHWKTRPQATQSVCMNCKLKIWFCKVMNAFLHDFACVF